MILRFLALILGVAWSFHMVAFAQASAKQNCVKLLQPFGGSDCVAVRPGLGTFLEYFGPAGAWLYNAAVGICVLWMLFGGITIMISSDNSGRRDEGIGRMKAAAIGLVLLIFGGVILRLLNSIFYQ